MDSPPIDFYIEDSAQRKGKGRATEPEASERTPLLGSSNDALIRDDTPSTNSRNRRRLYILLSTVFLSTLALCLIGFLLLFALAWSYSSKISNSVRDEVLNRALVVRGPDNVDVLNVTEGTLWLRIDGRIGIDATKVLDILVEDNKERFDFGATTIRRTMGRWAIRRLEQVTVGAEETTITSADKLLVNSSFPTISIPLTLKPPSDLSWLTRLSFLMKVVVTDNAEDLEAFAKQSWKDGIVNAKAAVSHVTIHGGSKDETGWRVRMKTEHDIINMPLRYKIPDLPGLPRPGKGTPFPEFSDMVTLESFNISTVNHSVSIHATASVIDPFPTSLRMSIPSLAFSVYLNNTNTTALPILPQLIPVAVGQADAFSLTHPNISLSLAATVPPLHRKAAPLLSAFVSAYLSGHDAPILVGSPLLPSLKLATVFPAPHPKPQILRDVQIKDMRLMLKGEAVLASGIVYARVVLPNGIRLNLDAEQIWPDVLIFDGEVPDHVDLYTSFEGSKPPHEGVGLYRGHEEFLHDPNRPLHPAKKGGKKEEEKEDKDRSKIPKDPLPSPLPERAFARIRPDDWLPAHSNPILTARFDPDMLELNPESGSEGGATEYEVSAKVENVPLEVLPGRERLLNSFVAKVLFGPNGALAGVRGTAAVAAAVDGLPIDDENDGNDDARKHVVELTGLPFSGSFRVGKKGF